MCKQKRIITIQDISCLGRCSITVALPVLSVAGIETTILPTAILSTHTGGFTGFTVTDLESDILPIVNHWLSLDDVHFDNIQVNANSVSIGTGDSAATIDPENNCKVDFEVTLSIPGDFYEFTIDVVNAGTIDGMIGTLNNTLTINNETVEEIPDYLDYSITYDDGVEIEEISGIKVEDGKSAYEIAQEYGFEGTEEDWINSLNGKDGNSIISITKDENNRLWIKTGG